MRGVVEESGGRRADNYVHLLEDCAPYPTRVGGGKCAKDAFGESTYLILRERAT